MRRMTRSMARAWLAPMRACLRQIRDTGEADTIRGYPVTQMPGDTDYARIDYCCAGFRALTDRLCPHIDSAPLRRIEQRLASGSTLTVENLDDAFRMLRAVENDLIKHSVDEVKDAVLIEKIIIELDEMRDSA